MSNNPILWIFAILNVYGVHSAWQTAVIKTVPGLSIEPIAILITVNTSLTGALLTKVAVVTLTTLNAMGFLLIV